MIQHKKPCSQCPFRRTSAKGWLGGLTPDEFKWLADSDSYMVCHKAANEPHPYTGAPGPGVDYSHPDHTLPQCAGRAIYWANQCKQPRDRTQGLLMLPKDVKTVFERPFEFLQHHKSSYKFD